MLPSPAPIGVYLLFPDCSGRATATGLGPDRVSLIFPDYSIIQVDLWLHINVAAPSGGVGGGGGGD